ncbi:MAG: Rne/Rng family ribonuclease [Acidobacteria bacterium]|nr:Rne/Rng family ribonuclease [Acidobacteriota bacterium]
MAKEIYISSTPHETRLAIVENDALAEIYYERENEYTLAGSIYNGRVTRVLPGMQSSFVDIGLERDAFLYITDFMEEAGDTADFEGEGSQRGGGQRRGGREPQTLEGQAGESSSRSGERGDRDRDRGRDRNRNRRDRDGRRGQGDGEYAAPEASEAATDESLSAGEASEENQPIGEGAPGADGSRRWRGRRGRRRGRGQRGEAREQAQGTEPQADASDAAAADPYESSFEIDGAEEQPGIAAESIELEGAAQENGDSEQDFVRGSRRPDFQNEQRNDQRNEQRSGRNDRGRGGRDRDRGGRRSPRGFEPKTSSYGADDAAAAQDPSQLEPIILPGESLSKYRAGGEEPASVEVKAPQPTVAAPSAPGYEIPSGWDGGFVLPGESLSRRRAPEKQEAVPAPVEHVAPLEEAAVQSETTTVPAASKAQAEPTEYEPVEASASYRVDPVAPSEFRQSAPVEEIEEVVEQHTELPHAEIEQLEVSPAPIEEAAAIHEQTVKAQEAEAAHDVTAIHASGWMESTAPVFAPVEQEAQHQALEEGAASIEEAEEDAIDDEDYDTTTLQASSVEELDDLDEEETLEGAADLGAMLREMSIDEITRPGEDEGEEEDFEEEHAVYDGNAEVMEEDALDTEEAALDDEAEYAEEGEPAVADGAAPARERTRDSERRRGRRDGRRGGRDRARHAGGGGDRERSGGRGRTSMQATNLPAISELLKPGQEILVQIAKEPIAKKGARITSHIALPGRFLVFMPTVNHTGVSRKIESDGERRRLKEILLSEKGDAAGGFIVRTAASGASEEELRSDLRFLLNLWADIKQRSESSKSPALIYHDLNLVERILRDQVTDNFSAIWVDSEENYERILRFLQRFQPSLIRRVKLYTKETPLFEQFGITDEINKALRSKVWLKSGGSIVINQTEALVAIDINTGKYVGKTARLEDTIVKTNLDAIPEIVRQIRLRDLGGIIIIDFIDMDERKNRNRVMAALEEELKSDRAPSKILQFNDFGLVAITRKRVKQSLERTLSTTCGVCAGTGMVKSPVTVCNDIYIEMRKMAKHLDRGDVMLRVHPDVVKQLKSSTKWLQEMEEIVGKTILVKSDPSLHPEQFDIH